MADAKTNVFCYADDLLSRSLTYFSMKKLLLIYEECGIVYNLTFNPSYCYLLVVDPPGCTDSNRDIEFMERQHPSQCH